MYTAAIEKVVTEYAGCTIRDLQQLTEVSDLHEAVAGAVLDAARNVARIEDVLRPLIKKAQRELERATEALDAGTWINEHGILQTPAAKSTRWPHGAPMPTPA